MGRTPKPAELKEAQGNPGKRANPRIETEDLPEAPDDAPAVLDREAIKIWKRLAPDLKRMKFLRATDVDAFTRYCNHLARYWKLTQALKREGETYTTQSRHGKLKRLNPKFVARERIEARLENLEDRFGLSPRARYQIIANLATHPLTPPLPGLGQKEPEPEGYADSPIGFMSGGERVH